MFVDKGKREDVGSRNKKAIDGLENKLCQDTDPGDISLERLPFPRPAKVLPGWQCC